MNKLLNIFLISMFFLSACNGNIPQHEAEQVALEDAANNLNVQIHNLKVYSSYQEDFHHKEKNITYKDTWHIRIDIANDPSLFYYIDSKSGQILEKGKFNKE